MTRSDAIASAELKPVRLSRHTASDRVQRAMLHAIARHDGEPITTWALKAESGLGERCVRLAIQALELTGLIRVTPGKPNTYHIQWERIEAPRRQGSKGSRARPLDPSVPRSLDAFPPPQAVPA